MRLYKVRLPSGEYLGAGLAPSKVGKVWSNRARLKQAFSYWDGYKDKGRIRRKAERQGWIVLEISIEGVRELSIEEFYEL